MLDLFSEINQALKQNKVRTALTGISVTWGVFMLVVLLSVSQGLVNNFNSMFSDANEARLQIMAGSTSKAYRGNRAGRNIKIQDRDLAAIAKNNPHFVDKVMPTIQSGTGSIRAGVNSINGVSHTGAYPQELKNQKATIISGRSLNDRDIETRAKVLVLPLQYAEILFPSKRESAVGSLVTYRDLSFTVVGVYDNRWSRDIFMPFSTAQLLAEDKNAVDALEVNLRNVNTDVDGKDAENAVRGTLAQIHGFDPDDSSALHIYNRFTQNLQARGALGIITMGVWVLGLLTLLTGIVGISNIMFVSVRERTHEIGIRRAIGAKPRNILTQVLAESVAITVLFGYIGIVMGTALTQIIGYSASEADILKDPSIGLSTAVKVTVVLVVAGALAGLLPARRALKIKPVEALRDE